MSASRKVQLLEFVSITTNIALLFNFIPFDSGSMVVVFYHFLSLTFTEDRF